MNYIQNEKLIMIKNLYKSFNNNYILYNFNLDIYKNEILLIIGKSGCGKSTFFKILLGFLKVEKGIIQYKNFNLINDPKRISNIVGFVSQGNSFYEKLTLEENLKFYANLYGLKDNKTIDYRINFLLELTKLSHAKKTISEKISGGMKRRLEFAISLIHDPEILILDEPFTGLDIKLRDELWEVITKIKNSGVTIIISTHNLTISQKYADRAVFFHKKRIFTELDLRNKSVGLELENKFYEVIKQ